MDYKFYRIKKREADSMWIVYSGNIVYGDFIKDDIVFWSKSITDCYTWIKAKQEGLLF